MADRGTLWTPNFILLNLQFMLVTCVTALFFQFHSYLEQLGFSQELAGLIIGADALASLLMQPLVALLVHPANARRWLLGGSLLFAAALFCQRTHAILTIGSKAIGALHCNSVPKPAGTTPNAPSSGGTIA